MCRYFFAIGASKFIGERFPWGTLLANMTGCFLIGAAFALIDRSSFFTPSVRMFFMTGFLGALTTFSTYALESVNYMRAGSYIAIINFLLNNIGGGLLVIAGFQVICFILKD